MFNFCYFSHVFYFLSDKAKIKCETFFFNVECNCFYNPDFVCVCVFFFFFLTILSGTIASCQNTSSKIGLTEVESHFPEDQLPTFPSEERSQSLSLCDLTSGLVELPFARLVMPWCITRLSSYWKPLQLASTRRVSSVLGGKNLRPLSEIVARLVRANLLAKGWLSSVSHGSDCPCASSLHRYFVLRRKNPQ